MEKLKELIQQGKIKNIELINENSRIPIEDESINVAICYDIYPLRKQRRKGSVL